MERCRTSVEKIPTTCSQNVDYLFSNRFSTASRTVVISLSLIHICGNVDIPFDVRIISATNENLKEAVASGRFREDLYHRLNEFSIQALPLRERKEDILIFANHFLDKANEELGKQVAGFDEEVMRIFRTYSWPGNLREMRNIVKRATL